jgi:hypothetical protein
VQAIVNEKIDLAEAGEQPGKASPAGTLDVRPSIRKAVADCRTDLLPPGPLKRRKVNTPETAVSAPLKRLQNTARGDAVSDPGFDNLFRSQVTRKTPYRPHKPSIAVIPNLKALRSCPNPFRFQFVYHLGPYVLELWSLLARPWDAQEVMQPLFPMVIGLVLALGCALLALSDIDIPNGREDLKRIGG